MVLTIDLYLANVAPRPLYKPLMPLLLIRSCAILAADLGGVPDLVPKVLRFVLAAATADAPLATRGPATDNAFVSKFKSSSRPSKKPVHIKTLELEQILANWCTEQETSERLANSCLSATNLL